MLRVVVVVIAVVSVETLAVTAMLILVAKSGHQCVKRPLRSKAIVLLSDARRPTRGAACDGCFGFALKAKRALN